SDIRVSGLEMSIQRFNKLIKTKIGNKFSQQTLEEDKRTLLQTKQFIDVTVSTTLVPEKPDSITVNFDLTPRRLVQYIKVIGNRKISKTHILEEIGMKRGETRLDPYDVENGRLRILELYKNKGYNEPHVDILRGDRPEDIGVVYSIDEGVKQRVLKTEFVGNKIASSARLKSLIISKPGFLYVIGGDFSRERLDEDVTKLLEYYRRLGFFDARIDREFEEGEGYTGQGKPHAWVTVRYVIDEGPRYRVRNFLFEGNKVIPTPELDKLLKAKKNEFYDQAQIEEDRIAIKYAYQDRGYVLAEIDPKQILTDEEGYLDIRYEVTEKDRYRVRDILISYDGEEARTKSSVILNMLDIAPGQLLNGRKIRASETSLRRSGYFNDKPNEGPLPTIKIIPEDEVPAPNKSEYSPKKNNTKRPASGLGYNQTETPETSNQYAYIRPVSDQTIRGQMRQIPTGFGNTTTSGTTYSSGNSVYVAPATVPSQPAQQAPVSSYGDTSMYSNASSAAVSPTGTTTPSNLNNGYTYTAPQATNQGNTGYNTQATAPANTAVYGSTPSYGNPYAETPATAPPIAGSTTGMSSNTGPYGSMVSPQMAAAPGFNAAALGGRDAVFPGSPQQQQLSQALGPEMTAPPIKQADVVASVKEGRTGMFQASIGVNSDYGLVGNVSMTERNFDLFRPPTSLFRADGWRDAFRGGGQIFQVQASPGTEIQRYSVSWDVPYIFNTKTNFGISGLYAERSYTEWFESRIGSEVRLGYQWTPRFSTTLNGSYYNVKISDPLVSYVPDLNDALGRNDMYTLGLSASYDTRNHPFLPSEGYVINGGAEMVMGDYRFPRLSLDARTYHTLHKRYDNSGRWILGLRSAAGWMDDAPIYERFYGGGSRTIRGFEYREVTPRFRDTTFGLGGNFEWYNSAEVLIPLSGGDEFQLALFVDTGTVASTIKDLGTYRVAPGFGFRISIPMLGPAPLALDFSFPVSSDKHDIKQVFSFDMTGSR
ncbi:MAG: POTRA domain-containing protein, partial [Planctomycetia bacterium]|nr:POTRA domain-containing protein [Planctomycetia bacterium]